VTGLPNVPRVTPASGTPDASLVIGDAHDLV
jgi:hypothetical protein